MSIFLNNLLPVFLVVAAGYALAYLVKVDTKALGHVVFYVFTPCLTFDLLVNKNIDYSQVWQLALVTFLGYILTGLLALLFARLLKLNRTMQVAVVLVSMLPNAGNIGLAVNHYAYGESGLALATVVFLVSLVITYTIGVMIASLGQAPWRQTMFSLLKLPTFYAMLLGGLFAFQGWQLPLPLDRPIQLLSDAAIPAMLVMLGMQLHKQTLSNHWPALGGATVIRLLISPLLVVGLASLLGLSLPALRVVTLEAAMPSAVTNTLLATQFDVEPAFISSVVLVSTALSPLSLTLALMLLGGTV